MLALIAEGGSNLGISQRLSLSPKTVEADMGSILLKLGIDGSSDDHRRVLAVLAFSAQRHVAPGGKTPQG